MDQSLAKFTVNKTNDFWDKYQPSFTSSNQNLDSWISVVTRINVFMIVLERTASIFFSVHCRSSFKKLILDE